MPCVVCQHCHGVLSKEDGITVRDGYSYHKKCHKCYVCSETNLKNAEVFKGVIFCYACSQRIFQGCSSARRSKNGNRNAAAMTKVQRRNKSRNPKRRPESHRRRQGVLELTRLAASSDTETSSTPISQKNLSNSLTLPSKPVQEIDRLIYSASKEFKKNSTEIGVTTEVTQELLRQINCLVVDDIKFESKTPVHAKRPREKGDSRYNKTIICSDLRIAELGASTEIAHMALRKKSEQPVIIKSENRVKEKRTTSISESNEDSVPISSNPRNFWSSESHPWLESSYSIREDDDETWLDRRIGSILKMPYIYFKNKILTRSSLISLAMRKKGYRQQTVCEILSKVRYLFREEITEHQRRGIKRLYSTINRRKTPYKLGWVNLVSKVSAVIGPQKTIRESIEKPIRCRHIKESHSYRCMRAQVMKLAGPTKSELAVFRCKLKNLLSPPFVRNAICYTKKLPSVTSEACGSDPVK